MEQSCDWDVECRNDIGFSVTDVVLDEILESVSVMGDLLAFSEQALTVPDQSNRQIVHHLVLVAASFAFKPAD